jgi:copper transport protein
VRAISRRQITAAVALVFGVAAVAWAHTTLVQSSPAADARLSRPPAELRLEFSEAVTARTSRIDLVSPDSQRLALGLRGDTANAKILVADVPELTVSGQYRVEWRLVGPDGHAVTGRYVFTIDTIPTTSPVDAVSAEQSPTAAEETGQTSAGALFQKAVRFLSFLSMVVIIGAIAFAVFVLPGGTRSGTNVVSDFRPRSEGRLRSLAIGGSWLLLVLAVVRLTSHAVLLSGSLGALRMGDVTDLVLGSTFGRGWLLQVVTVIVLLIRLRSNEAVRWRSLVGVAMALAISASFLGHPAAVPDVPLLAMGLDAAHVLAAGGWAGGILVLTFAVLPQLTSVPGSDRVEVARGLLRAFTPLALSCATVLAVTGAAGAWLQLRDLGLVLGSEYGLVLVRKVVLVLIIAALGAYHWRVVQPAISSDRSAARLRTSLAVDAAFVLLVLVVTAFLTGTAPPAR